MKSPFYLVWSPQGYPPKFKHTTYKSAEAEATRLARANPWQTFYVLGVLGEVVQKDIYITRYEPEIQGNC